MPQASAGEPLDTERRRAVICTETAYPPYSYQSEQAGKPTGFNAALIRAVAAVAGLEVEARIEPWSEIRADLEAGRIDAICGMYYSPRRDEAVDFTVPFTVVQHAIFTRTDGPDILSKAQLRGRKVLVMAGDIMHDWARRRQSGMQILTAETIADVLRRLAAGEADCALVAELPGYYWIRQLELTNLRTTGPRLRPSQYCFAVREGDLQLQARLNEALAVVRQSGRLREIQLEHLSRYEAARKEQGLLPVRIGILTTGTRADALARWGLLGDYLTDQIQGYAFEIVPLDRERLIEAVSREELRFVLADPATYVLLEVRHGASRIATLRYVDRGKVSTHVAGAIFCLADRQQIRCLRDLRGKRLAATRRASFAGWTAALREMDREQIDPFGDCREVSFLGPDPRAVLEAVRRGEADAGVLPCHALQKMVHEGRIDAATLRTLNPVSPSLSSDACLAEEAGPFHSTPPYPHWPLAMTAGTPDILAGEVSAALLRMPPESAAARAAHSAGWSVPRSYQQVHECLKELRAPPYETHGRLSLGRIVGEYWPWMLVAAIGGLVALTAALLAIRSSRRLRRELVRREEAESQLTAAKARTEAVNEQLRSANKELIEAMDRADRAAQGKSAFLANMSHEIRTPLTAILGFAELLQDSDCSDRQAAECRTEILRNGEHLLELINDILDLSKIEAGRLGSEQTANHLEPIVRSVAAALRPRTEEKGLDLKVEAQEDLPPVCGDEHRLRQVLFNLVGNAIKFTDTGFVLVSLQTTSEATDTVCLSVLDTGIGMTQEMIARIGDPFTQADSSTTRRFGGTGLGLAITKRLVEAMNGRLCVESKPEEGSTFRVILPAATEGTCPHRRQAPDDAGAGGEPDRADLRGIRVLLAEDHPVNAKLAQRLLKKAGAEVRLATNGQEALEAAAAEDFDVLLLDMQMPVMDGFAAARRLRESGWQGAIVALTAGALAGDREKCLQAGCDDYLTKPIDRGALYAALGRFAAQPR